MSHPVDPLASARALIDEPAVSPRCALPHVIGAWCAAAECDPDELVARLHAGAVGSIPSSSARARAIATLQAAVVAARAEPWADAAVPSRRALRACVGALERAGRPRRRWRLVAALASGLVLLLGMHLAAQRGVEPPGAWRATYFANPAFAGTPVEQVVASPSAAPPVAAPYSARFTGCMELGRPVEAAFQLVVTGGATLYVDGAAVIEAWAGGAEPRTRGHRLALEAGQHTLRVDAYGPDASSMVTVLASLDGGPPVPLVAVVPCAEVTP